MHLQYHENVKVRLKRDPRWHATRHDTSLWRNRLARSAVNRKVGGSSPPRDEAHFCLIRVRITVLTNMPVSTFVEFYAISDIRPCK